MGQIHLSVQKSNSFLWQSQNPTRKKSCPMTRMKMLFRISVINQDLQVY